MLANLEFLSGSGTVLYLDCGGKSKHVKILIFHRNTQNSACRNW